MESHHNMKHQGIEYIITKDMPSFYDKAEKFFPAIKNIPGIVFANKPYIHVRVGRLEPDVLHHEIVHFRQQEAVGGPDKWWDIYFNDPKQRFNWELEAYQAQYKYILIQYSKREHWPRLKFMAENLVKIYKTGINLQQAMKMISDPSYPQENL